MAKRQQTKPAKTTAAVAVPTPDPRLLERDLEAFALEKSRRQSHTQTLRVIGNAYQWFADFMEEASIEEIEWLAEALYQYGNGAGDHQPGNYLRAVCGALAEDDSPEGLDERIDRHQNRQLADHLPKPVAVGAA